MEKRSSFYTRILDLAKYITFENVDAVKARLEQKSMPEPNTGCFIWIGPVYSGGYGRMWIKDKLFMAHRVAYFLDKGTIPKDLVVDHLCDNPLCVNPVHLEVKIQRDNGLRATESPTTINANKTHCIRGHEFTPENTYWNKGRVCIICSTNKKREHYLKNKERYNKEKQTEEWRTKNKAWRKNNYQKNKIKNNG